MSTNLKETKIEIAREWQSAIPQLSIYATNKFYKVVGPVVIGVELIKLPRTEEYRPHFVVYSLFGNRQGNDIKACMDFPIIMQEYRKKNNSQFAIPFEQHAIYFKEALASVEKNTPISFSDDIPLKQFILMIDEYAMTLPLVAAPNSYLQAALQGAKLEIALYLDVYKAQSILKEISQRAWDINHFKLWGVDIVVWQRSLQEKINNREAFLRQIAINKSDKKINQLKVSELIS